MQNAISTLSEFPSTKKEIKSFIAKIMNDLKSGNLDSTEIIRSAIYVKAIEKTIKELLKSDEYREIMVKNFKDNENYDFGIAKVEPSEVSVDYDFSSTNDSELFDMYERLEQLKKDIKERETFLKNIKGEVYGSDGVQLFAPIKSSTSSIKITLK